VKEEPGFTGVFVDDLRAVSDRDGLFRAQSFKILSRSIRALLVPNECVLPLAAQQRALTSRVQETKLSVGDRMRPSSAQKTVRSTARRRPRFAAERGERYTPRRLAQFLLENATNAGDYAAARREVRKLGLDPDKSPHDRPPHA
jgi:hypothetical protein